MSDRNSILLPLDFSELSQAALPWARRMAYVTDGYSGLQHVVLGSTTEAALRKAGCPVLSVRSS